MVQEGVQREIQVPEGVEVSIEGRTITVSGAKGRLTREFPDSSIEIRQEDGRIVFSSRIGKRKRAAIVGTYAAQLRNMIQGVTQGFRCRLRVISSHFPISLDVKETQLLINNFLGERHPRIAKILDGVDVSIEGDYITVSGIDKDLVAQTAANIEQATIVRNRDRRIFQDGIYLVEKATPLEE